MSVSLDHQRAGITDRQTFRQVLRANEGHDEEPVYHQEAEHSIHHKHPVGQDSVQEDTHINI